MTTPLRIGTRGSRLAMWQARHIAEFLRPLMAPRRVELVEIQTTGDRDRNTALAAIGGQGVFTKEIQQALLDRRADLAVHSLKDLPTLPTPGLVLAAVPERAATGDVFVSHKYPNFDALPPGARVATGSTRRRAQVLNRRPDLLVGNLRGNVETRLRKLRDEDFDGIILARAGMERLDLAGEITESLDAWMLPAVGQGALGLETRADDAGTQSIVRKLNHEPTWHAVLAERAFLRGLGGGCLMPIAARAIANGKQLHLTGTVFSADGRKRVAGEIAGPANEDEELGGRLAQQLLGQGARELLST
jgi:hydroxymethylbilane synthase